MNSGTVALQMRVLAIIITSWVLDSTDFFSTHMLHKLHSLLLDENYANTSHYA